MQAIENAMVRARKVGIEGQPCAGLPQGAPRISAFDALRAYASFRPWFVFNGMGRLHRGDNIEFRESVKIIRMDDLGVFDAMAAISCSREFLKH